MKNVDIVVVGGGIVGLATAFRLLELSPSTQVTVLEKESVVGDHQSGRNSGVVHSGIYYRPGSEKARHCRQGRAALEELCVSAGLPYERCGKVIVAVEKDELGRLHELENRGLENGVECEVISHGQRLAEIEPHCVGLGALRVADAAIVDYRLVCRLLAMRIAESGGEVRTGTEVTALALAHRRVRVEVRRSGGQRTEPEVVARVLVNCGGLFSDRIAEMAGARPRLKIVPFRGEYYRLAEDARHLCRGLIYPVPDPSLPFLGVHLTRTIDGQVLAGPNAVLAGAREGYRRRDINLKDVVESITFGGLYRFLGRHPRAAFSEVRRSMSRRTFVAEARRLVPALRASMLTRSSSGVRAQAMTRTGDLVDDFAVETHERTVHVLNAPSPAATASLSIGEDVARRAIRVLAT